MKTETESNANQTMEAIQRYFEALNWGRPGDAAGQFDPGCQRHVPPLRRCWQGADAYLAYWRLWRHGFTDLWLELEELRVGADWGFSRFYLCGTHNGLLDLSLGTILPTGRRARLPMMESYGLVRGRFTHVHTLFDLTTLMRQLHCAPPAEAGPCGYTLAN